MQDPTHLGDGAYVHRDQMDNLILTANHHDPKQATDTVSIDCYDVSKLLRWIERNYPHVTSEFRKAGPCTTP